MAKTKDRGRPMTAPTAEPELFRGEPKAFAEMAPPMTEETLDAINGLFRAFVFRRAATEELWTTCCRKHVELKSLRTVSAEMLRVFDAESTPEPRGYGWGCSAGWRMQNERSRARIKCPICGREATLKELGRTGKRQNLDEYCRAVALRWHDGALWAVGYRAKKSYYAERANSGLDRLTLPPSWTATAAVRLRPGAAEMTTRDGWYSGTWQGLTIQTGPREKNTPFPVGDPFTYSHDYGRGYDLIGWEEVDKSPFRWMRLREIQKETEAAPLRLLVMGCFYARQMEMLHKFGLDDIIKAYAERGTKTAWLVDWNAAEPKKFLRLPLRTVTEVLELDPKTAVNGRIQPPKDLTMRMEALKIWKQRKGKDRLEDCIWEASELCNKWQRDRVRKRMQSLGLSLERVRNYLQKQQKAKQSVSDVEQLWTDYLDAAEHLGLDLANEVIYFPGNLRKAHDERCNAWGKIQEIERKRRQAEQEAIWRENEKRRKAAEQKRHAEAVEKGKKILEAWEKKYTFSWGGLKILMPTTAQEITDEGKALRHCVGGYADRHLEGATTILFLRREDAPKRSLVTVEMSGNTVRQAHGYRNEADPCDDNPHRKPIMTLYKDFFDCWLDWLKRGSPRDKEGKPKIGKEFIGRQSAVQKERKAG